MKITWTARAVSDLFEIGRYIARDNRWAARQWTAKLKSRACKVARNPHAGRQVPEFGQDDIREVFLSSYRIVYQIHKKRIDILTVFEGHRLLLIENPQGPFDKKIEE